MREVLRSVNLDAGLADTVQIAGAGPVLPSRYDISTAGTAALGALGVAMANLREAQTGQRPSVGIDVYDATIALRSAIYAQLNGAPGDKGKLVSGFYRVADDRWNYFHCNTPIHERRLLEVLKVPADRDLIAAAALKWNAFELEQAVDLAGGCAPVVRTPQEWRDLPNTALLAKEPLIDLRRIGDAPPIPLPKGPLPTSGLRVLDLTRVLAGPTCGRLLAESGADVLKITTSGFPDSAALEIETGFRKRNVVMDLRTSPDREHMIELIKGCDVFVQAYRTDSMARLGLDAGRVAALRPGIIYVSLDAYGFTGPWRTRRGFDTVVQSASGMAHVSADDKGPKVLPVSCLDYLAGYFMALAVLHAMKERAEKGGSYEVRISLARVGEWLTGMGLLGNEVLSLPFDIPAEQQARLLIELSTPVGRVRRMRPVIHYSDPLLNTLPDWPSLDAGSGLNWLK
jgi:crotonobetainyl-CoA:carnitine CoA-transferase CaiB-like acyl-CoA transferase